MTTGIKWDESTVAYTDPANSCAGMERSQDWIQFVLDQPLADAPGAKFVYSSGNTELLAHVIKTATGKHAHEYAAEHLFAPLGITDTYWKRTPTGLSDTEGGLYLTPRDLAKIGYLYLNDGVWDGQRLLPEGWVARPVAARRHASGPAAVARATATSGGCCRTPTASAYAYAALGYGGQRLIVIPEHQVVAVFTGWNIYEHAEFAPYDALDRLLKTIAPSDPWIAGVHANRDAPTRPSPLLRLAHAAASAGTGLHAPGWILAVGRRARPLPAASCSRTARPTASAGRPRSSTNTVRLFVEGARVPVGGPAQRDCRRVCVWPCTSRPGPPSPPAVNYLLLLPPLWGGPTLMPDGVNSLLALLSYLGGFAALLLFPRAPVRPGERASLVIDLLITAGGLGLLSWVLVTLPSVASLGDAAEQRG